jgi:hypothetical protein
MRIIFDGRQVESLEPKIARHIGPWADTDVVEGVILAPEPIVAAEARRSETGLWVLCGIVAAILIGAAIMTLRYEPGAMVVVGPIDLAILVGMALGGPAVFRRNLARRRDQYALRSARMAPPGTAIRLDATDVTFAGRTAAWRDVAIDAVEIVTDSNPDGDDGYHVEALVLDIQGQPAVLDQGLIVNGGRILDKILLTKGVDLG